MLHWGKSLLLSLLLIGGVLGDFVPNWGNLEMIFFNYFFFTLYD